MASACVPGTCLRIIVPHDADSVGREAVYIEFHVLSSQKSADGSKENESS